MTTVFEQRVHLKNPCSNIRRFSELGSQGKGNNPHRFKEKEQETEKKTPGEFFLLAKPDLDIIIYADFNQISLEFKSAPDLYLKTG